MTISLSNVYRLTEERWKKQTSARCWHWGPRRGILGFIGHIIQT